MALDNKLKRKIRKIYGFDLLPVAMEDCKLGDVIEWDGIIKKNVEFQAYSFVNFLKIDDVKKKELKERLANVLLNKTGISKITIDSKFDFKGGVDIPNFAVGIGAKIGNERFIDFSIDNVKSKIIARDLRIELMNLIKDAKEEDRRYYRQELKRMFIITQLFYAGNVNINFKNTTQVEIEGALTELKIAEASVGVEVSRAINVSFKREITIPFAADIEPLKDFID